MCFRLIVSKVSSTEKNTIQEVVSRELNRNTEVDAGDGQEHSMNH